MLAIEVKLLIVMLLCHAAELKPHTVLYLPVQPTRERSIVGHWMAQEDANRTVIQNTQ